MLWLEETENGNEGRIPPGSESTTLVGLWAMADAGASMEALLPPCAGLPVPSFFPHATSDAETSTEMTRSDFVFMAKIPGLIVEVWLWRNHLRQSSSVGR
jgi:hypothetical protein